METNREKKWLESDEVYYKEPAAIKKVNKPVPEVTLPPFSNTQKNPQQNLNFSNQQQADGSLQSQPSKDDAIL